MHHRRLLALVVALGFGAGCAAQDCTLAGCRSGVTVNGLGINGPDMCFDGECHPVDSLRFNIDHNRKSHIITIGTLRYEGPVALVKLQPNGAKCGPTCWRATLVIDGDTLRPT